MDSLFLTCIKVYFNHSEDTTKLKICLHLYTIMASERPPIFTAIVFRNGEDDDNTSTVTAPLINYDDEIRMGNEEEDKSERKFFTKMICLGTFIGFLIQVVSLGAYIIMLVHWGDNVVKKDEGDWFIYTILTILTQIDLCLYAVIWIALTCTGGLSMLRGQIQTPVERRFVFFSGVHFLVGVVMGAFIAWSMIDAYLGFIIPFLPIVATVIVDLMFCYMMKYFYDIGNEEDRFEEEDETPWC